VSLLTNQEIFNAYLVWGDQQFDLTLLNHTSSWLITVDAAVSFAMLVAVAAFWKWWGTHHREPDEISKMIIGSLFTIAGGLCLFRMRKGQRYRRAIACAGSREPARDHPPKRFRPPARERRGLAPFRRQVHVPRSESP